MYSLQLSKRKFIYIHIVYLYSSKSVALYINPILHPLITSNDIFLLTFEALFSMLAGYIAVLVYEYAAKDSVNRAARAQAANTLNMGFQVSMLVVCFERYYSYY